MRMRKGLAAVALAVMLAACSTPATEGTPPPAESVSPSEPTSSEVQSAPEPPPEESESSAPEEAVTLPDSVYFSQKTGAGGVVWELEITDPEELEFLAELLSTEGLTPCDPVENPWPEGGSPPLCQIHYGDLTVDCGGYPQAVYSRDGKILLRVGEERYQYPQETGEKLIAFLEGKKVTIE